MFYYEEKWYITILKWLGTLFLGIVFFIIINLDKKDEFRKLYFMR